MIKNTVLNQGRIQALKTLKKVNDFISFKELNAFKKGFSLFSAIRTLLASFEKKRLKVLKQNMKFYNWKQKLYLVLY